MNEQADVVVLGMGPGGEDVAGRPYPAWPTCPTGRTGRRSGIAVGTGMARIPSSARGWIHKAGNEGLIKLVADAERDVLVGATSAGPSGGEVLSMLTLAVHAQVSLGSLRRMIYAYPTFHRAVEDALRDLADG